MSGRNNQKVNFNLRLWNTVVPFRADTDTHSRRMFSLHIHACQAIMRNFLATKAPVKKKYVTIATMYSYEKQIIRKEKKQPDKASLFYGHYHYDNYGYKNFPVYNYTLTGWSKTLKTRHVSLSLWYIVVHTLMSMLRGYLLSPGEWHLLISSNIKVILTSPRCIGNLLGTICRTSLRLLRNKTFKLPELMKMAIMVFETLCSFSNWTLRFLSIHVQVLTYDDHRWKSDATLAKLILSLALFISIPFVTTGHSPARFHIPFDRNLSALNFIAQCEPFSLRLLALHKASIYLTFNIEESEITQNFFLTEFLFWFMPHYPHTVHMHCIFPTSCHMKDTHTSSRFKWLPSTRVRTV